MREREAEDEADRGDQAGGVVGLVEGLRDHRVGDHRQQGAGADRLHQRRRRRRKSGEDDIAGKRQDAAQRHGDRPDREDARDLAAGRLHPGARRQGFGDIGQEHRDEGRDRHAITVDQAEADDDQLRHVIHDRANRDGSGTGVVRLAYRSLAMAGAGPGKGDRDEGEEARAAEEAADDRRQPGVGEGLVHQVEGDDRDQDAAAEAHHQGDDAARQVESEADRRADQQPAARGEPP